MKQPSEMQKIGSIKRRNAWASFALHATLITLSVVFLAPLMWMVVTSLKPADEIMGASAKMLPSKLMWSNYPEAFSYGSKDLGYIPFLAYGKNTLVVTILAVIGSVLSNSLVAYSFARLKWPGRDIFFALTLATMMVPYPVLMVPTYSLFKWLGWIGTFRPLWVPCFFGSAFSIFLLRQFFKRIPMELSEAAKIDGASELRIYFDVVLPLAKPAMYVIALFTFMWAWNDFMGPLLYLTDQNTFTLSMGLQFFQSQHTGISWNLLMAASLIVIIPVLLVYFFAQRVFIEGIATTGIKS